MDNFDLRKFLTENNLTSSSRILAEAVIWNWDGDRNSLEFNSDQWADIIKDDTGKSRGSGLHPDYDKGGKYYSEDGAEAFRIQPFKLNDIEYTKHEANRMGKYIVGLEGEELEKFISDYMGAWEADKGDTEAGRTFREELDA